MSWLLIGSKLPLSHPLAAIRPCFRLVRALGVSRQYLDKSTVNRVASLQSLVSVTVACGREYQAMSDVEDYRNNAEDCLRMAEADKDEQDRPLWATLAVSWLRLAEDADRIRAGRFPGAEKYERAEG